MNSVENNTLQRSRFHIAVCGATGVGKSTLARILHDNLGGYLCLEELGDHPFVQDAFHDPYRWSFTNQVQFVVAKMVLQAEMMDIDQTIIQEMDAYAAHHIWTPVLLKMGYVSEREAALIEQVVDLISISDISVPDLYVVLEGSPGSIMQRIRGRYRDFEVYFPEMHRLLELLKESLQEFASNAPSVCLTFDTNRINLAEDSVERQTAVWTILGLISKQKMEVHTNNLSNA